MSGQYYASKDFAARRQKAADLTTQYTLYKFDEDGKWVGGDIDQGLREYYWFCMAFLQHGSPEAVRKANRVMQRYTPGYSFCHFMPLNCFLILHRYGDKLEPATVQCMDEYVRKYLDDFMPPDLDFVGSNDNFPCMAAATVLFAGQRYGGDAYVEKARYRLRQLKMLLARRGFASEFTSPTYTAVQLLALAEIASFAEDEEIKQLALESEKLIFADLLMHLHWPTAQLGGAFSRGYPMDAAGCTFQARFIYYMLYGEELSVGPIETILCGELCQEGTLAHCSDDFMKISLVWIALPDYHCPEELGLWGKNRQMPFICAGTSECIASKDSPLRFMPTPVQPLPDYMENPQRVMLTYTYMTDDYALGTSRFGHHNGYQSQVLRVLYRKKPQVTHQKDIGTIFTCYEANNDKPWPGREYFDMGNAVCLQEQNTAMALYTPRILYNCGIYSLRLTVNITAICGGPDELWIGERRLPTLEGGSNRDECVFVRDGDVYVMLYPLNTTPANGEMRVSIRKIEALVEVSFLNYSGPAKNFDRAELQRTGNGVAVEVRSADEYESFEHFMRSMAPSADNWWHHTIRKCRYENNGRSLELVCSPASQSVRYAQINDGSAPEPRLYASEPIPGIPTER